MAVRIRYVRPKIDAVVRLEAAAAIAVEQAGKLLLDASQPLVPVDTGELRSSGKAEMVGPHRVKVSYHRSGADGYDVAVRQHEDATLHHPGGGEDHFLSKPVQTEGHAILEAMVAALRAAL